MENRRKVAVALNLDWPIRRYHDLFKGIQEYATKHTDWTLVPDHLPDIALKESGNDSPHYIGIIGRIKRSAYEEGKRLNVPMVNTWASNEIASIPTIIPDYEAVGFMAAKHLLKRGFRNFVQIDYYNDGSVAPFSRGVQKAIAPHHFNFKQYLISRDVELERELWVKFQKDFSTWTSEWNFPLAVCSSNSCLAPKISTRCLEHGFKIPEDIAIATAGNELAYCETHRPHISAVDVNYHKIGYHAAKMLHKQMEGIELESNRVLFPVQDFIARESTDTYAVEDTYVKTALRFIADNVHRNIQVLDIVEHVPIARRSLEIRFKKAMGRSIMDEINRLRILNAKRMLIESNLKINKLHEIVGFSTPLHMRRIFSKHTGMTPGQYRKSVVNQ